MKYWAKLDNKEEYTEIERDDLDKLIMDSITSLADTDIARVINKRYGECFRCEHQKRTEIWWHFNGIKWNKEDKGISLRKKISDDTDIVNLYAICLSNISQQIAALDDDDEDS